MKGMEDEVTEDQMSTLTDRVVDAVLQVVLDILAVEVDQ